MLPTIATGNVGSALAGEYEVANSLRFNDGSTDYLSISGSTPDNRKKFTYSFWFKRSHLGTDQALLSYESDSNNRGQIMMTSDQFRYFERSGGSTTTDLVTNRLFRDSSAWYNIIVAVDTTQATDTNRVKIYVNGVQETSFATSVYPSQNYDTNANGTYAKNIGRRNVNTDFYLDGYLTEVVFIDGTQQANTDLGEFDSDTNIWKPIDVSGLTFGTNGFYLDFENSGSLGADVSGNGNNFTVNNLTSIDQTTDTCTNNFATLNSISKGKDQTLSEGNLKMASGTATTRTPSQSTIGVSSGKWYAEFKILTSDNTVPGVVSTQWNHGTSQVSYSTGFYPGYTTAGYGYTKAGDVRNNASAVGGTWSTFTTGDIIGVALDLDNDKLYFSKNGTWQNSGDPTSGATGTGAVSITTPSSTTDGFYYFSIGDGSGGTSSGAECNFGNPMNTISSGNSDGNGYGNFEYSVPSGYYALNTKNLAEYG